jgi:acetyl esterase/lipase
MLGDSFAFGFLLGYLDGKNSKDPLVSPFWGDLTGFPPLLIETSKNELPYFDNINFAEKAKAANVQITFHAWADMVHGFPCYWKMNPGWPEIDEAIQELDKFIQTIFL